VGPAWELRYPPAADHPREAFIRVVVEHHHASSGKPQLLDGAQTHFVEPTDDHVIDPFPAAGVLGGALDPGFVLYRFSHAAIVASPRAQGHGPAAEIWRRGVARRAIAFRLFCVARFHWDPESYLALMREEVPDYEELQEQAAGATGAGARRILELGTGTGETARRVLARHPNASLTGIDASGRMLDHARAALPADRVELIVARLEDPLPDGPFDLVVAVLAVHHLDGPEKADLFSRVAAALSPGGRFVLGDVVVPDDPADAVTPIDGDYDTPSSVADQQGWMEAAGLWSRLVWARRDLAVLAGEAPVTNRRAP
jgi:SAM-dependent methyltransferase